MNNPTALFMVCLALTGLAISGCSDSEATDDMRAGRMVYVDTKTMQPFVHDIASEFPAGHPETGKRTLMPALYCPECKQWHAVPPVEQINRMPGATRCRKTRSLLTADGPWPDDPNSAMSGDTS